MIIIYTTIITDELLDPSKHNKPTTSWWYSNPFIKLARRLSMVNYNPYNIGFQAGRDALSAIEDYFYGKSEKDIKTSLLGLLVFLLTTIYTISPTPETAEELICTAQKNAAENWERGRHAV